jgi:hypothetical protein
MVAPLRAATGLHINLEVKQALLRAALPDGKILLLVILTDERTAILRDEETVYTGAADAEGMDTAVHMFTKLSRLDPSQ